jgi:threonine synthase
MSKTVKHYQCTVCNKIFPPDDSLMTCPVCQEKGILEIVFDYELIKKIMTKDFFLRNHDPSMFRYWPLLTTNDHQKAMLKVGGTPLYEAKNLAKYVNLKKLYLKDESVNPSGSLKDRASAIAVLKAIENHQDTICCSSTGNAASSLACHAARMGLKSVIFVPDRAPIGKLNQLLVYGSSVFAVMGDYQKTFELSKQAIQTYGWYNRNAAINPHLVEGKKTVAFEIAEALAFKPTDWVIVSVGDGCTLAGVYKGFYDFKQLGLIDHIPRLLGVQSSGCSPFVDADLEKRDLLPTDENTLADSISVGVPRNPIKAIRAIQSSKGAWMKVSDDEILLAMKELGKYEGLFGEPASVASIAGLKKAIGEGIIKKTASVTVILTGSGLKDPKNAQLAVSKPISISPDFNEFKTYIKQGGHHV